MYVRIHCNPYQSTATVATVKVTLDLALLNCCCFIVLMKMNDVVPKMIKQFQFVFILILRLLKIRYLCPIVDTTSFLLMKNVLIALTN